MAGRGGKRKGAFIVFEGLDGAGVSTQAVYLENYLRGLGYSTLITKEPTIGIIGGLIRSALRKEWKTSPKSLQLLFCADRGKHLYDEIEPAVKEGKIVICDRYLFSTIAYGAASGEDAEWLWQLNRKFLLPDVTVFLDIRPDVAVKRIAHGRLGVELFEHKERLQHVRSEYMKLKKKFNFLVIDGERDVETVREDIGQYVADYLRARS